MCGAQKQPQGLQGGSNLCFFHASLQALYAIPDFRRLLMEVLASSDGRTRAGTPLLKLLARVCRGEKGDKSALGELVTLLRQRLSALFTGIQKQQDANEFVRFLLDLLNREAGPAIEKMFCQPSGNDEGRSGSLILLPEGVQLQTHLTALEGGVVGPPPRCLLVEPGRREGLKQRGRPLQRNSLKLGFLAYNFELVAVVQHLGRETTSGHLVTWRRGQQGSWWRCDDDKVTERDEGALFTDIEESDVAFFVFVRVDDVSLVRLVRGSTFYILTRSVCTLLTVRARHGVCSTQEMSSPASVVELYQQTFPALASPTTVINASAQPTVRFLEHVCMLSVPFSHFAFFVRPFH